MTGEYETVDVAGGMLSAAVAPALVGAFIGLAVGGPGVAMVVFGLAFMIAALHVVVLAIPLHGLLTLLGWQPGPGTALVAGTFLGALPAGLFVAPELAFYGGLFGLMGGGAFCAMSTMQCDEGETGQG